MLRAEVINVWEVLNDGMMVEIEDDDNDNYNGYIDDNDVSFFGEISNGG